MNLKKRVALIEAGAVLEQACEALGGDAMQVSVCLSLEDHRWRVVCNGFEAYGFELKQAIERVIEVALATAEEATDGQG